MKTDATKQKTETYPAFTLVEVLIYVILMTIVGGAITGLVLQTFTFRTSIEDRARVNEDIRILVKSIRDDMYLGDSLDVVGGTLEINSSFSTPAQVTYSLVGGQVLRQEGAGASVPVTSEDTEIRVFGLEDISTPSSAGVIRVTLEAANYPQGPLKTEVARDITTIISLKYL